MPPAKVRKVLRDCKDKVIITVIDVGMVITLNEQDRKNFINFINSVLEGNGKKCAKMIYSLSIFDGKRIEDGQFEKYHSDLKKLFKLLDESNLDNLPGL